MLLYVEVVFLAVILPTLDEFKVDAVCDEGRFVETISCLAELILSPLFVMPLPILDFS